MTLVGDLADDELKKLSQLVVDFARRVGLRDADDDDLLGVVIAAYMAGKKAGSLSALRFYRGELTQ